MPTTAKIKILSKPLAAIKAVFRLAFELAKAEFKMRNEGSYLGLFWYILNPILTLATLYLVFSGRLGMDIQYYPLYLLLGLIMFNVFQSSMNESSRAISKDFHYLIKSINFPRESLILSIVIKNIFSHIFDIVLFAILLVYFHISLASVLFYIPALILLTTFTYGACLAISSLTVYFVDLDNIWAFGSKIIWFVTPIFYAIGPETKKLYALSNLNPMYHLLGLGRDISIYHRLPSAITLWGSIGFSAASLLIGMMLFRRLKRNMAEHI